MMKKYFTLLALFVLLVCSCSTSPKASIKGNVAFLSDSSIVLHRLNFKYLQPVDTLKVDAGGNFSCKVELKGDSPAFYYLYSGDTQLASLVLLPSDKVVVNVARDGSYQVTGSEESLNLKSVNEDFLKARSEMYALADEFNAADSPESAKAVQTRMSRLYVEYKRAAIKRAVSNPYSITSAAIMFQKFSDDLPVFNQATDAVIFRSVYDSLYTVYPQSEYLVALMDEIESREKQLDIETKLKMVESISFPELSMPDVNGEYQVLSKLEGKVIILSFWSAGQATHKLFNNDLAEIYAEYHDKGLEIYQVSLDTDKAIWASAVKNQALPWISVNDGNGVNSQAVVSYNVAKVPAMFVIGRDGSILGKDVFDKSKLAQMVGKAI